MRGGEVTSARDEFVKSDERSDIDIKNDISFTYLLVTSFLLTHDHMHVHYFIVY